VNTKLKAGVLGVDGVAKSDRWYVTNGATAVGPVHLDVIARGIENGQVPMEAFLRHDTWKVWRPLADFAVVVEAPLDEPVTDDTPLPRFTLSSANDEVGEHHSDLRGLVREEREAVVRESAIRDIREAAKEVVRESASDSIPESPISVEIPISFDETPYEEAPFEEAPVSSEALTDEELLEFDPNEEELPSAEDRSLAASGSWPLWDGTPVSGLMPAPPPPDLTDDITAPARPLRRDERLPGDALAGAADLQDALLLTLAGAVDATSSDAAILHRVDDDGAHVTCAHGPDMLDMLGARTRLLDAAVVAAAAASTVIAEPTPGIAGQAIIDRLSRLGITAEGAFMVPIRPHGRLLALLEVGRKSPYRALEVAEVEKLVDALVHEIETRMWGAPQSTAN